MNSGRAACIVAGQATTGQHGLWQGRRAWLASGQDRMNCGRAGHDRAGPPVSVLPEVDAVEQGTHEAGDVCWRYASQSSVQPEYLPRRQASRQRVELRAIAHAAARLAQLLPDGPGGHVRIAGVRKHFPCSNTA